MINTTKKYGKVLSFLPLVAFTGWTIYFLYINRVQLHNETFQDHEGVVTTMLAHYDSLLLFLVIAVVLSATVLLYFVLHLARLRSMNSGTKITWIVFMVLFGAFAFPVFWYQELRKEPNEIDVYPDIA